VTRRKSVLGKGLSALIPDIPNVPALSRIFTCGIEQIYPNPRQPRKSFDQDSLDELAASISEKGILQPLLVRKVSEAGYELIAGERRWRAAQLIGLQEVPIIVMDVDDVESIQLSLIENIQRDDLNPLELADSYRVLLDLLDISHDDLSQKLGKKRSTITNILRLCNLPDQVQEKVRSGAISMGHARAILSCDDSETQIFVSDAVVKKDLSVRQTEKLINTLKRKAKKAPQTIFDIQHYIFERVQKELADIFQARVRIISRGRGKRIQIDFSSDDDLTRIVDIIKKRAFD